LKYLHVYKLQVIVELENTNKPNILSYAPVRTEQMMHKTWGPTK